MKLLVSLTQTGGEYMVLSTAKLLGIGLITPLLLLVTLARLLIKTPLKTLGIGI